MEYWSEKFWEWITGTKGIALSTPAKIKLAIDNIKDAFSSGWDKYVAPTLSGWTDKFWEWATGTSGVSLSAEAKTNLIIGHISDALASGWVTIKTKLSEWSDRFWDWALAPGGALDRTEDALNTLTQHMQEWADTPDTHDKMQNLGYILGQAVFDGIRMIFTNHDSISELVSHLPKMLLDAIIAYYDFLNNIGADIATGIIDGFVEAITGKRMSEKIRGSVHSAFRGVWAAGDIWKMLKEGKGGSKISVGSFASGGIVPGPTGAPRLAVVHGGETVIPVGRGGGDGETTVNIYFTGVGAPRDQTEADNSGFLIVNALKARGLM